ncbi:MAG: MG2 domain-containing protein [Planctomycetota bacterium]
MDRNEGNARAPHARQGNVRAATQRASKLRRGAIRAGAALFCAGLLAVNGAGWVWYGAKARSVAAAAPTGPTDANARSSSGAAAGQVGHGASGAAHGALTVAHVLPSQDVLATDRLTVVFAGPVLAPPTPAEATVAGVNTQAQPELASAPFRLTPELLGRWEWASPSSVAFVLERPLTPGLMIEAQPTAALEQLAGRPVDVSDVPLRWATGPLSFQKAALRSSDRDSLTVELTFDAEVDAQALAAALRFEVEPELRRGRGRSADESPSVSAQVLTVGAKAQHVARVDRRRLGNTDAARFVAVLPKGFEPAVGTLGLAKESRAAFMVPRVFDLIDRSVEHGWMSDITTIQLRFDRQLDSGQEAPPVTVEPAVAPMTARVSGNRIVLEGPFECRHVYTIRVGGSLLAADGSTLGSERRADLSIPARPPSLSVANNEGILTPDGGLNLVLKATNVPSVEVKAFELLPGNLVPHLRGERSQYTSRNVLSRVYPLEIEQDVPGRHALDLRALFASSPGGVHGVYAIEVRSTEDYWERARATVRITDLAPTVKRDEQGYHVWVRSLTTGEAVVGATVSALTITDQLVASASTDAAGYAALPVPADDAAGAAYVVTVEREGDLGYALLSGASWTVPRELTEGRTAPRVADVFLYTERRLYRPGDTVHLSGIARTPQGEVYTSPLRVVVARPDGVRALDAEVAPDLGQGVFHLDVPTSLDARTGTWTVEVSLADAAHGGQGIGVVGRARFNVEAFLSARLVITAERAQPEASVEGAAPAASQPPLRASVRSLAGTSVEDFPVAANVTWKPIAYTSARYDTYTFERGDDTREIVRVEWAGALDADGHVAVATPGTEQLESGRWRGRIDWTVTEPGGRSASTTESVVYDAPCLHIGLALGAGESAEERAADDDAAHPEVSDAASPAAGGATPRVLRAKGAGDDLVAVGAPLVVRWVTLDAGDAPVAAPRLGWRLERVTREARLEQVGGHLAWTNRERVELVATGLAATGTAADGSAERAGERGLGTFEVPCEAAGRFRLSVRDEAGASVTRSFYAVEGDLSAFVPPLEDLEAVVMSPLVPSARPGETIEVDVRAPFDGSLLVTLEDTRLRSQQRIDLVGGSARVYIELPRDLRGGAFLSAQVTRPLERRAAWRPHRAYGWTRIRTTHLEHDLAVQIDAPAQVRPGGHATVTVALADAGNVAALSDSSAQTTRPAAVQLYAVDEGIRVTGGDRRPEPARHFLGARAHTTRTTDSWFDLLPDIELPPEVRRIGGDSDFDAGAARRRAPEEVHRVPGVLFQTFVDLGADGRRSFELDVPDFLGTLTWIAVVVDGDQYGSAEARTLLRGELPLSAALPRFVAPGDRFIVPVTYENTTAVAASVALELALEGPVRFVRELDEAGNEAQGGGDRVIEASSGTMGSDGALHGEVEALAGGAHRRRWLELEATAPLLPRDGTGRDGMGRGGSPGRRGTSGRIGGAVRLYGTLADGREVSERVLVDVPVRTGRPLIVASFVRALEAGADTTLDLPRELGLDPADLSAKAELVISPSFEAGLEPVGHYLLGYPYGCAEQTSSRIIALLSLPRIVNSGDGPLDDSTRALRIAERVAAGIDRLWSMQTYDGGFAYWPGQSSSTEWATLYVAEVLCACKEAGHDVPAPMTSGLARYLERRLKSEDAPTTQVSLVRTLTALGHPQRGWAKRLSEQAATFTRGALVELAYSAVLAGDLPEARRFLALTPSASAQDTSGQVAVDEQALAILRSPVRTLAYELRARLALDPSDPLILELVRALDGRRDHGRYRNTVDNAAALAALARFRAGLEANPADWTGTVTTSSGTTAIRSAAEARMAVDAVVPVRIETQGEGLAWVTATVEGRRAAGAPGVDHGLSVRRRWLDETGNEVDPAHIELGALVTVEVTAQCVADATVEDVAIVDALPGGFEVENPRLANTVLEDAEWRLRQTDAGAVKPLPALEPDRVEFLDDRVVLFADVGPRLEVVRYHLRAVALGSFERAPIQAEAMYDPERSSVGGPTTTVTVVKAGAR